VHDHEAVTIFPAVQGKGAFLRFYIEMGSRSSIELSYFEACFERSLILLYVE
jgi:hypothetical protein